MSETIETPPPPPAPPTIPGPQANPFSDERQMPLIIYILYLASFLNGVTAIVGVVLAYVSRDTAPEWLKSHYTFQIRTFWIGLLLFAIAVPLCFIIIGIPMVLAAAVWFVVRCVLGLSRLTRAEPYPTPLSWVV
jgi:uncharacterized membrane protein